MKSLFYIKMNNNTPYTSKNDFRQLSVDEICHVNLPVLVKLKGVVPKDTPIITAENAAILDDICKQIYSSSSSSVNMS